MKTQTILITILLCSLFPAKDLEAQTAVWRSKLYPADWTPGYKDEQGRFLHDFSYAGYMKGEAPIPESVGSNSYIDVTKPPYNVDNSGASDVTASIQRAIDDIALKGGGTVYLPAGTYHVKPGGEGTAALYIRNSNTILRGAGRNKTFIYCPVEDMRNRQVIRVGNTVNWDKGENNGKNYYLVQDIPDEPVRKIFLDDVTALNVDDWVIIRSDRSQEWINEHQMGGFWAPGTTRGTTFYRRITAVNTTEKSVSIDIPTRYYMKTRDNARLYKVTPNIHHAGLENFSIGNKSNSRGGGWGEEDYKDANNGSYHVHSAFLIRFSCAVNSWAKNVASYKPAANTATIHMSSNGLDLDRCRNLTIDHCDFSYPQYEGGGGNGYALNFCSQECLISHCSATSVRHAYAFKYAYTNGNVITAYTSVDNSLASDFHMYLSMSNLIENQNLNKDYIHCTVRPYGANPGDYHGVTSSQTVFWNINGIAPYGNQSFCVESGQHGYGYIIGTKGNVIGAKTTPTGAGYAYGYVNTAPEDYVEGLGQGSTLEPYSLYYDQLSKRLGKAICLPVVASGNDGNLPENVLDGNLNTRWSVEGDGQWIEFCPGNEPATLSGIRIAFQSGNMRKAYFDVLVSENGNDWRPVSTTRFQSGGRTTGLEDFLFPEMLHVKKVRIVGYGNSSNKMNSYTEIQLIYGSVSIKALPESSAGEELSIYPNPWRQNGTLTVQMASPYKCIKIKNIIGKTVFEGQTDNDNILVIERLHFAPGIYVVEVSDKWRKVSKLLWALE